MIDDDAAYKVLSARDRRFDGEFFTAVLTTGIYCRPICPAKTPARKNCRFYASAAEAEKHRFRPCLRCRPELAPGRAPVDRAQRIAHLLVQRINEGAMDESAGMERVAADFGISSRQLRRIVRSELGVAPIELLQTRRLLLAKQLLTETRLPVTEIAFASGFSSLRRFNAAFSSRYRMPPSRLRKEAGAGESAPDEATSRLRLGYRPPYDWTGMLAFLQGRMIRGVEWVSHEDGGSYLRTVRIGDHTGWVKVTHLPAKHSLQVEFPHSLTPGLPALLGRLRDLFDLTARPDLIATQLGEDPWLQDAVRKNPGQRVPGAFDPFEMAVRAVLGQQVTVKAATTAAGRVAEAFGEPLETPFPQLSLLTPEAGSLAGATVDDIARLGIIASRSRTIIALAQALQGGRLRFDSGAPPEKVMADLLAIPGIGPWTAHYLAMRALRWPDAFPKEDIAIRNRLGGVSAKVAEQISGPWRPWRSYAVLHLWRTMNSATGSSA